MWDLCICLGLLHVGFMYMFGIITISGLLRTGKLRNVSGLSRSGIMYMLGIITNFGIVTFGIVTYGKNT